MAFGRGTNYEASILNSFKTFILQKAAYIIFPLMIIKGCSFLYPCATVGLEGTYSIEMVYETSTQCIMVRSNSRLRLRNSYALVLVQFGKVTLVSYNFQSLPAYWSCWLGEIAYCSFKNPNFLWSLWCILWATTLELQQIYSLANKMRITTETLS